MDDYTKEMQEYILKQIQNEQKNCPVTVSNSAFPSLGESNPTSQASRDKISKYEKLLEQSKKKKIGKSSRFVSDKWEDMNNEIHNVNKPGSAREII